MRFQGIHCIRPKSGWLLSYGSKGVRAAMVSGLARFLTAIQQTKKIQKKLTHLSNTTINYKDGDGQEKAHRKHKKEEENPVEGLKKGAETKIIRSHHGSSKNG